MIQRDLNRLLWLEKELGKKIVEMSEFTARFESRLSRPHRSFVASRLNFLSYLRLRQHDLKTLQLELTHFGLSSLGRSESFVQHNLEQTHRRILESLQANLPTKRRSALGAHTPPHPLSWEAAEKRLHRHTRDLLGPKPARRHVSIMVTAPTLDDFSEAWMREVLRAGCNLIRINAAHDSKEAWKKMISTVRRVSQKEQVACRILMDLPGPKIRTRLSKTLRVTEGDTLVLGRSATKPKNSLECTYPEVLAQVRVGQRVLFDDGKIETRVIERLAPRVLKIEVTRVSKAETKLRSEKGINFPDSELSVDEFPPADFETLRFAAQHCDLVGLSFVQDPSTLRRVREALSRLTHRKLGLVLKIETRLAFTKLPELLLEAMAGYPVGVMIARGDLGVEIGFERMAEVQEEILCLCEAAHVPVIWATQVLESSAKSGIPTRSEVTDAATSVRAECVMLNKGPFIIQTVKSLDDVLRRMESHTYKRRQLYRPLKVALLEPPQSPHP